ncbi:MAG: nuclease-related domain-containing protein [Chloroflexota bacterium]
MQVVVNQKFLDRRALYARIGTWGGIGALTAGFVISFFPEYIIASWVALILGLTAFNIGHYNSSRYVTRPREDEVLAYGLKGLDHRFRLLNYMKETPSVSHILVGPSGVYPIHVRRDEGTISNRGNKWSRKPSIAVFLRTMFEGGLGNPTNESLREAGAVRKFLTQSLGEEKGAVVPITPLIVFSDQRTKLDVQGPSVPVFTPRELKTVMRKQQREVRVDAEQLQQIGEAYGL